MFLKYLYVINVLFCFELFQNNKYFCPRTFFSMQLIQKYFKDLSPLQVEQFSKLQELYKDWNLKINVVSRKDIDELYLRHVLHSLGIAKVIKFKPGSSILDVGTGGG